MTLPPVVFEDDALIAFNKPSGLLVAPDRWDKDRANVMRMVHTQLSPHYFNAHRIDAETSGLLLCAKTKPALDHLCHQFQEGKVAKEYLALTRGAPREDTGRIDRPLEEDPARPGIMRLANGGGKKAVTDYTVLERWRGLVLIQAQPLTGRTHQIRVHLAGLGCPIVADRYYGKGRGVFLSDIKKRYKQKAEPEKPLMGRLALHAHRLTLLHPVTGEKLAIEAPLPKDFELTIKYLRRFAG